MPEVHKYRLVSNIYEFREKDVRRNTLKGLKTIDIEIIEVDKTHSKILHSNGTLGYWARYRHYFVEGCCYFVPYNSQPIELFKNYSVETSQESVINIRHTTIEKYSIKYIEKINTYQIIGTVSFINEDKDLIVVSAQDVDFCISNEEYEISNIRMNDWLEVEIEGLSLWDEGIY
ncbi:hypothetical protein VN24_18445 [Paenibacillus beijingensis]|uniref:Uncharacterized protein n=1 Tax=Paenibacillus beijingensis TaxID=1126833 RepID=A0A0D5NMQ0_9BACL|nr:hypothetical protein VN24_18445 [Paenibacillus beijingensis]